MGVCLTAVDVKGDVFQARMMPETLSSSKLGDLSPGDGVNLERSLRVGGGLDGHIVLGHVDEVGRVTRIEKQEHTSKLWVSVSSGISWGVAPRGSVTVDGVSLTVIDSHDAEFSVGLIPATLDETTLGLLSIGDCVNIEIDVLARYIARLLGHSVTVPAEAKKTGPDALSWEKLEEYGWL
jgi:riboflavin synthase